MLRERGCVLVIGGSLHRHVGVCEATRREVGGVVGLRALEALEGR